MSLPITDLVAGIFKPAVELIDELHTSKEEKLDAKARLIEAEAAAVTTAINYERGVLEARANIIATEAGSEHMITAIWRPVTMLTFLVLVVLDSFGLINAVRGTPLGETAYTLLTVGLGAYVGGRTVEKVVKAVKQ